MLMPRSIPCTMTKSLEGNFTPSRQDTNVSKDSEGDSEGIITVQIRRHQPPRLLFGLLFQFVIVVSLAVLALTAILLVGEEKERRKWATSPSTIGLYKTNQVCAVKKDDGQIDGWSLQPQTYEESNALLEDENYKILNCGHCGSCSNLNDIAIYYKTRNTLTEIMTGCSKAGVFGGGDWKLAFSCLKQKTQMTDDCTSCWIGNAVCNMKHCPATCVKHRLFPWMPDLPGSDNVTDSSGRLDPCFDCDERLCGPDFVQCSGANRRRAGIVSDIARDDDNELCKKVDFDLVIDQANKQKDLKVKSTTSSDEL